MFKKVLTGCIVFCSLTGSVSLLAQDKIVDQIIAVVGSNIIMKSDIEGMYMQNQAQGVTTEGYMKCEILENFLVEKLLLAEAELDTTIIVTPSQINQTMDERMQYFIKNLGSEQAVEKYFQKSIAGVKADLEEVIRNQHMTSQMRRKIIDKVSVTPAEVRYKYRNMEKEKVPMVEAQVEYAQISVFPSITLEEENEIKSRLREFKKRVEDGENFSTLAVLYSEDPGSAANGGELGYLGRAQLDPAYAAAAFNLKEGRVSNVVRSEYGYHIIQLVGRRGEQINTRHILIMPKPSPEAREKANNSLDSLASIIRKGKIAFETAALHYSADKNSRNGGGIAINPYTMSSKWKNEELEPNVSKVLATMKENEISDPFSSVDENQRLVYRIVKLISRSKEHRANLQEDYQFLHDLYLQEKQEEAINKWVSEQQSKTYIHIDDTYLNCNFKFKGWKK
ncbi:MAG: peptidylprolyl isomerase [Prolixibacteraceae bacterium]